MGKYSVSGRTVMIQFECGRCGKKHIEPFEKQLDKTEGNLHCYKPPEGWLDNSHYIPILCDICAKGLKEYLARAYEACSYGERKDAN